MQVLSSSRIAGERCVMGRVGIARGGFSKGGRAFLKKPHDYNAPVLARSAVICATTSVAYAIAAPQLKQSM